MIHILDSVTANGIAAGEVVERPASVVKELVENALDARATRINIEIEQGGIKLIRVQDNGHGMTQEDLSKCFLRHATSKLMKIKDLDTLSTMGFRGEALASIAAVSRVKMESKVLDAEYGHYISIEAGKNVDLGPCACAEGSFIEVRDLFYNTPARYKFLKRDSTEAAYVDDLIERMAFTRPDVSFRLLKDGKEIILTPGNNDLQSTIYSLWGKKSAESLLEIDFEIENIKVGGYISNSSHSRKNRSRYVFVVNQRVIQSALIRAAVDKAIQGHFVKSTFPEMILVLQLPTQDVDINVHPQKTELRFRDEQDVFRAVYHSISSTLAAGAGIYPAKEVSNKAQDALQEEKQVQFSELSPRSPESVQRFNTVSTTRQQIKNSSEKETIAERHYPPIEFRENNRPIEKISKIQFTETLTASAEVLDKVKENTTNQSNSAQQNIVKVNEAGHSFAKKAIESVNRFQNAKYIGSAFNTYLLFEDGEMVYIIDQHAAHERVLYEKLLKEYKDSSQESPASQILMQAIIVPVTSLEMEKALDHLDQIKNMGFDFERFSDQEFVLRAVPDAGEKGALHPETMFRTALELAMNDALDHEHDIEEAFHTIACKAAVKAYDSLDEIEVKALIHDLQSLEDPYHCPHGRPVIVSLKESDFEKMFQRIV